MKQVLVAGATGFVGMALTGALLEQGERVVALSRHPRTSDVPNLEWRSCDLYSLKDIAEAVRGCTHAYYLVHSMLPASGLSQGTFYDTDLILADNFARACRDAKVEHVVYLGGLIPEGESLSWHLRSRLEVEEVLAHAAPKVTLLRAGMVVGRGGSSFSILTRLVERLPVMLLPKWTQTRAQPVDIDDLTAVLCDAITNPAVAPGTYDVGGPDVLSYEEMMRRTARALGRDPAMLPVGSFGIKLSRLWVMLVTGAPRALVYPLVLSLRHPMLVRLSARYPRAELLRTSFDDSLRHSLRAGEARVRAFERTRPSALHDVRSVQRFPLPEGRSAEWVTGEYVRWLPEFFSFLIRVTLQGDECMFYFLSRRIPLLVLRRDPSRSSADRQLLYIVGGHLAAPDHGRGRLEFREVLRKKYVLAAIHDFRPALPWIIYKYTQAIVHLIVMHAFGRHLRSLTRRNP